MSTSAQITANQQNALSSTGPNTEEGKSKSSQNAVRHGLFTQGYFVRPHEESTYRGLTDALNAELCPVGVLEQSQVAEIRRATWRLEMCAEREAELVAMLPADSVFALDALRDEAIAKLQNSIDRARSQTQRQLRRAIAELRRLQTERQYRNEIFQEGTDNSNLGICDYHSILKGVAERDNWESSERKRMGSDSLTSFVRKSIAEVDAASLRRPARTPATLTFRSTTRKPLAERTQSAEAKTTERTQSAAVTPVEIARNAPCPCNSGRKYKRCCGENAPAVLSAA
jgi:hypothetical protein